MTPGGRRPAGPARSRPVAVGAVRGVRAARAGNAIRRNAVSVLAIIGGLWLAASSIGTPVAHPGSPSPPVSSISPSSPLSPVGLAFALGADDSDDPEDDAIARAYLPVALRGEALPAPILGAQLSELRFRDPALIGDAARAGAAWYRTFVFWDEVEPVRTSPPTYDWRHYDPLLTQASESGMRVIAEISGNPTWVADFPGGPVRDIGALAEFLAAAVERYDGDGHRDAPGSPVVRFWELYNEPDNGDPGLARQGRGWGYWGGRGAEYARMLRRVYPVVKLVSPDAQVVFGGVAWESVPSFGDPFDLEFIDDVLDAGGGSSFDYFNIHYYPLFAPRWADWGPGVAGKVAAARSKLARYGVDAPIMVTEAGMWSGAPVGYPDSSPADQARYVPQLFSRALASGVPAVIWFHFDDVEGTEDPLRGLVDGELRPKPAHAAYRLAADLLGGAVADEPVRDIDAAGEVYRFTRDGRRLAVAWTDGPRAVLELPAPAVLRVHFMGGRLVLRDTADGSSDGITRVPYGADPVYLLLLDSDPGPSDLAADHDSAATNLSEQHSTGPAPGQ